MESSFLVQKCSFTGRGLIGFKCAYKFTLEVCGFRLYTSPTDRTQPIDLLYGCDLETNPAQTCLISASLDLSCLSISISRVSHREHPFPHPSVKSRLLIAAAKLPDPTATGLRVKHNPTDICSQSPHRFRTKSVRALHRLSAHCQPHATLPRLPAVRKASFPRRDIFRGLRVTPEVRRSFSPDRATSTWR